MIAGGNSILGRYIYALAASFCLLAPASTSFAGDDGDVDVGGERCIDTRRISASEIIDDQNILFRMRDHTIYHNELPRRCPGLSRNKIISYRTTIGRLCSHDNITLLDRFGTGLSRGPSCGLGKFRPISNEEAQALKGEIDIEPESVPPAEPEEPEVTE